MIVGVPIVTREESEKVEATFPFSTELGNLGNWGKNDFFAIASWIIKNLARDANHY